MTNSRDVRSEDRDQPARSTVVLRALIVLNPLAAVGATWLAAGHTVLPVAVLVGLLAALCAVHPDSHFGVLVVVAVAIEWIAIVDHHATAWSMAAAACLTIFHAALAAATVAPESAPWTRAMQRRWFRRTATLVVASAAMWVIVVVTAHVSSSGTSLFAPALLVLAAGAIWASRRARWSGERR